MNTTDRVLTAIHRKHREDRGKLEFQIICLKRQLEDAGLEPDIKSDEELMRLWKLSADTVSAAAALLTELGTSAELIQRDLIRR